MLVLGSWVRCAAAPTGDLTLDGLDPRVADFIEAFQPVLDYEDFDRVRRGALERRGCWDNEFGTSRDLSALGVERNVFRYRPAEVVIRLGEDGDLADLARVLVAGVRCARALHDQHADSAAERVARRSSTAPNAIRILLGILGVKVESDDAFNARVARDLPARIRLIGGDAVGAAEVVGGSPDTAIWAGE